MGIRLPPEIIGRIAEQLLDTLEEARGGCTGCPGCIDHENQGMMPLALTSKQCLAETQRLLERRVVVYENAEDDSLAALCVRTQTEPRWAHLVSSLHVTCPSYSDSAEFGAEPGAGADAEDLRGLIAGCTKLETLWIQGYASAIFDLPFPAGSFSHVTSLTLRPDPDDAYVGEFDGEFPLHAATIVDLICGMPSLEHVALLTPLDEEDVDFEEKCRPSNLKFVEIHMVAYTHWGLANWLVSAPAGGRPPHLSLRLGLFVWLGVEDRIAELVAQVQQVTILDAGVLSNLKDANLDLVQHACDIANSFQVMAGWSNEEPTSVAASDSGRSLAMFDGEGSRAHQMQTEAETAREYSIRLPSVRSIVPAADEAATPRPQTAVIHDIITYTTFKSAGWECGVCRDSGGSSGPAECFSRSLTLCPSIPQFAQKMAVRLDLEDFPRRCCLEAAKPTQVLLAWDR